MLVDLAREIFLNQCSDANYFFNELEKYNHHNFHFMKSCVITRITEYTPQFYWHN